jgi:hypothetical protein
MAVIKFSVPEVRARVEQLVRDGYLIRESRGLYDLTEKPKKKRERGQ